MKNQDDYQIACNLLKGLICDISPDQSIPDGFEAITEFSEICSQISQIRQAIIALSNGNLDYTITQKGYLPGALKGLQASLKHMTWQAQSIATGDFTQRVDFMGKFSESFNQMTEKLDYTINELQESREKYRLLAEFTSDVIWVLDPIQKKYTYISPSVFHLRGYSHKEVMQQTLEDIIPSKHLVNLTELIEQQMHLFVEHPEDQEHFIYEVQEKCKNGGMIWTEASVKFRCNEANAIELVGVTRNIEERKQAENNIKYLSYHDQLTGLYNRRFYEEELVRIDCESNLPLSVIMADINGLKLTNDAFGHTEGDLLLKNIATVLEKECRKTDILARIGGDEFAILMPQTEYSEAKLMIKHMRESLSQEKTERTILSLSFGLATKTRMEEKLGSIFTAADDQMYHDKLTDSSNMKSKTIHMIIGSLFEKDKFEKAHCERVSDICKKIGLAMNLPPETISVLKLVGMLHDIGKIGIDEHILKKNGELSKTEWNEIKRHPEIGYQILHSSTDYAYVAECVLSHHERLDGKGYPRGLTESEIPFEAKVLAVAEAFDDMVNPHEYKDAISEQDAIQIIKDCAGTKFDTDVVNILVEKVIGFV